MMMNRGPPPGGGGGGRGGLAQKLAMERLTKEQVNAHKTGLPQGLLSMFAPLPPVPYKEPIKKKKPALPYGGMAQCVEHFAAPGDPEFEPPPKRDDLPENRIFRNPEFAVQARIETDTKPERVLRIAKERTTKVTSDIEEAMKSWDPAKDPKAEGDPFKTLFIGRLDYNANERKLKREFEEFGPVKRIRIVTDESGKPRGYAFVEFEHKNDMKNAYKIADGRKVEGKRIVVDVERGRTVPNWRPRRLGGGKGGESRAPRDPKKPAKKLLNAIIEQRLREAEKPEEGERRKSRSPSARREPVVERPRDRSRDDKERPRERPRERSRDRDRERRERERSKGEREKGDKEKVEKAERSKGERERGRGERSRERGDKDRERGDKDKKRDRDREEGERSSKRPREEGERANGHASKR